MSKIHVRDSGMPANVFRVASLMGSIDRMQFGNGIVTTELQEYLKKNIERIEDMFAIDDSLYILPLDKNTAKELLKLCVGEKDEYDDYDWLADEIEWIKLGDRYWLSLWWD